MLGLLLVIIAGVTGFSLWFTNHYKGIIKAKLPGLVAKATDSLYQVSVEDISINILTRRVTVTGVRIWADTMRMAALYRAGKAPLNYYKISAPSIQVSGVDWESMATDKELNLGKLSIYKPEIVSTQPPVDTLHPQQPEKKEKSALELVTIKNINIINPAVSYRICKQDTSVISIRGGNISMTNWRLDPQQPKDQEHFLYAERAVIDLDSFSFRNPKSLYDVTLGHIRFATDSSTLALKKLEVKTNVSHADFYRSTGHQKDIFHILFGEIQFQQFDWKRMQREQVFAARSASLDDALIDIFFSRLPPPNTESKMGNFPNQLLMKLPLKIDIPTLKVANGHFKYTEVNEDTKLPGVLMFDNISGSIANLTNVDAAVAANSTCTIKLHGNFMKKSPMDATFYFALNDKDGAFSVDGSMTDLDEAQINGTAKALAKAEIKSLHVNKLQLHVGGDQYSVKSDILVLYKDLEVDLKKVDGPKQLSGTPLLSFLANKVLLYKDNPMPGEEARTAHPVIKRDPYKSFFNQIWKCIFNGAQQIAIKSDNLEKALEAKQAEKGKPEKEQKSLLQHIFSRKKKK